MQNLPQNSLYLLIHRPSDKYVYHTYLCVCPAAKKDQCTGSVKPICIGLLFIFLQYSADRKNISVGRIGNFNTAGGIRCMNNLSAANVDTHMA